MKMYIDPALFTEFSILWENGEYEHLRYGQAFYNHFRMDKMNQQPWMNLLYNAKDDEAVKLVFKYFMVR